MRLYKIIIGPVRKPRLTFHGASTSTLATSTSTARRARAMFVVYAEWLYSTP